MRQCPRRSLLGGIAATASLAVVGTASAADDATDADTGIADVESSLEALPAAVAGESTSVTAIDYDGWLEADHPHDPRPTAMAFDIDAADVETMTTAYSFDDDVSGTVAVVTGDVDPAGEAATRAVDGVEYDRYEDEDEFAAVVDDLVVVAADDETLEAAVAASAGERERLLEADARFETAFRAHGDADYVTATVTDADERTLPGADDAEVQYTTRAMTVLDPDTIETVIAFAFADEAAVTDDVVESVEGELAYVATSDQPTIEVDGALVTATAERDLAAERAAREHDSPGSLRPDRETDAEDDVLELEVGRGDQTPIEDLTLELDDEEYDRDIWADGHGTLEEGDTIVVDMDDVEPNLSISLRHDHEAGASSSGTTILNDFAFDFAYDHDAETLAVTYADNFELDGDDVTIAAYDERPFAGLDEDEPEPLVTADPWTGQTVTEGDDATLDGVSPGDEIVVGWQGTSYRDGIAHYRIDPPGTVDFDYEYDNDHLSATLEIEDERPAAAYELLIDEEPADTQWTDETDTVVGETTIGVTDVPVGADVSVVWDDDVRVGGTRTMPTVELALDDGTVEHVGGDELPASELEARILGDDDHAELALDDEITGEFEEGDSFEVDVDDVRHVTLIYDDRRSIGFAHTER